MAQENLENLSLEVDIGSAEGLSVDQLTRSRIQFLLGQNSNIVRQSQFADAKAGTLLAIVGVLTLIVANQQTEMNTYLVATHFLVTIGIVAVCLVAILPRVPSRKDAAAMPKTDLFSWPSLSGEGFDAASYASVMRTSEASQLVMSLAKSNVAKARILNRKYSLLRRALFLAFVDLIALLALLAAPAFVV